MEQSMQKESRISTMFRFYYFFVFFGLGVLLPLLGVYLNNTLHLSGTQIGTITSTGSIVMIFIQPLWGMLCDYTQKPREVLFGALLATGMIGFLYSTTVFYPILVIIAVALALSQSAIIPISDSIALNYVQKGKDNYGSIRLYGSLGFALAVLVAGRASQSFGMGIIFYLFAAFMFAGAVLTWILPKQGTGLHVNLVQGCQVLVKNHEFLLFLGSTFFIFGPINANNTYFGLLIMKLGGTLTAVGIMFLLSAGSEAPFMSISSFWMSKLGVDRILMLSALVSAIRWLFYFCEPPLLLIYITTIAQGLSIGFFVPAAVQYVRDLASNSMRSTAVALYAAAGSGFGTWFSTILAGVLMDHFGIPSVYLCFFILTVVGLFLLVLLFKTNVVSSKVCKDDIV